MTWQRVDLSDPAYAQPTEPPITCGLLYRGKRHALSGPPEAAKTLAALIMGLEHMRAGDGLFALVDFEMGEHATRLLLHDLGATLEEISAVYYVGPSGPPDQADIEAIAAAGVTLVVIDAAAGAYDPTGLDDNKRQDAEKFGRAWVKPLWKRKITTVLIDHVTKNAETRGRYAIGSERKLGGVDVHLGLEAIKPLHRGADGLIRISTHKDRPGHLPRPRAAELELRSNPETHQITWTFRPAAADTDGTHWKPTALMEKVSRYLETQAAPVSRNVIEKSVTGKGEYLRKAMDELVADGHARETADHKSSRLLTSITPYRDLTSSLVPTSSQLVPDDTSTHLVPSSRPLQRGTRDEDEDDEAPTLESDAARDEVERLLAKHNDLT